MLPPWRRKNSYEAGSNAGIGQFFELVESHTIRCSVGTRLTHSHPPLSTLSSVGSGKIELETSILSGELL